ncbi:MAG: right-handed parallel beta-helix repeat-containing protein [Eubacterium sp.]|nr:right-handed parallel beta-helix repeat-containing protein [Eubacterium sp.]
MKKRRNKKRIIIAAVIVYLAVIGIVAVWESGRQKPANPDTAAAQEEAYNRKKAVIDAQEKAEQQAYDKAVQLLDYDVDSAAMKISLADCYSIMTANKLPALSRMAAEDSKKYMGNLQVLQKIEKLGIDTASFETPELNWKNVYNRVSDTMQKENTFSDKISFTGSTASQLNTLIAQSTDAYITIESSTVRMDEPISMKSGIALDAAGVTFTGSTDDRVAQAVIAEDCTNFALYNLNLTAGCYEYGIYIIRSNTFTIENCTISNALYKGLVMMGENKNFTIRNNTVSYNGNGAVFLNGNISNGIIAGNDVVDNYGTRNLTAGIVMTSMEIDDYYTAYNEFKDEHLYNLLDTPHDIVLYQNNVKHNNSSGIYSDGAYQIYIVENIIYQNDKEGMCLDYGTFGAYVSNNIVKENGGRLRQSDEDLEADFVTAFGRLSDGSSPAKLPGISIDNSAYNTIVNNNVTQNYGSGVKMVRSAYRNIIMENSVSDNNKGKSDDFHFFGIEIGHESTPDEPVKGLDFTASYENIVCRNIVTGSNYAGVFLAVESYCNDVFDNTILGSEWYAIECHSNMFNSMPNNIMDQEILNLYAR